MKSTTKNSPTKASSFKTRFAFNFIKSMKNINYISSSPSIAEKDKRYKAIRAAAYASMASAVGSRKAWSRAILRKIRNCKLMRDRKTHHRVRKRAVIVNRRNELGLGEELNDLAEVLPGGKAMDSCRLLNETGHYIKCLRAQVEIMRQILDFSRKNS